MDQQHSRAPGVEYLQLGLQEGVTSPIADLESLTHDIAFARQCATTYIGWMAPTAPKNEGGNLIRQALWSAGAISYRRAFTSGKGHLVPQGSRLKIKDGWKELLNPEQLDAHEKVLEIANKHIAHRVGDHEGVRVIALLNPPPLPRAVAGVATMMVHRVGPDIELAEHLLQVCDILLQI